MPGGEEPNTSPFTRAGGWYLPGLPAHKQTNTHTHWTSGFLMSSSCKTHAKISCSPLLDIVRWSTSLRILFTKQVYISNQMTFLKPDPKRHRMENEQIGIWMSFHKKYGMILVLDLLVLANSIPNGCHPGLLKFYQEWCQWNEVWRSHWRTSISIS